MTRVCFVPVYSTVRHLRCACAALLLAGVAACEEGPTAPGTYSHTADGKVWTAVMLPFGTPGLHTWLPYLKANTAEAEAAQRQVRSLRVEAERLRRSGEFGAAAELQDSLIMLVARSLSHTPPPTVMLAGLSALDSWLERATSVLGSGELSDLSAAAGEVKTRRRAAAEAMLQRDTAAAVVHLASAAELMRRHSPSAVAMGALLRAEERLSPLAGQDMEAARALRLLRNARIALADGDETKALRRALYALQIAERHGLDQRFGELPAH